jgi:hypothetical protein
MVMRCVEAWLTQAVVVFKRVRRTGTPMIASTSMTIVIVVVVMSADRAVGVVKDAG